MAKDEIVQSVVYDIEISSEDTKGLEKTNKEVDKMGSLFERASTIAKGFFAAVAVKKIVDFTVSIASMSEKLNIAKKVFTNFTKDSGRNFNELMDSMRTASGNTMTDIELLAKANVAKMFKIQTPVDNMIELARKQAKISGDSIDYVFNSLVTGIARKSKPIIDNLGLIVDQTKAEKKMADELNKSVKQLTLAEKDRAFELAVIVGLQENIKRSGIDGVTTIEEVGKKINVVYTKLKDVLGNSVLPFVQKIAGAVSTTLDDFLVILEQKDRENVRGEIVKAENKRNAIMQERVALMAQYSNQVKYANEILTAKQVKNAKTLLESLEREDEFQNNLNKRQISALQKLVKLREKLVDKVQEEKKARLNIAKVAEESRKKSIKEFISRKKTAEQLLKEKELVIQINIEREKKALIEAQRPKQLEILRLMEEDFRISSIEDERNKIIELNKFELAEAKKKFTSLNKEELTRVEEVYKGKLKQQLAQLDDKTKPTDDEPEQTGLEITLERMKKDVDEKTNHMGLALDSFASASQFAMQRIITDGKVSAKDLKNMWFEQASARLTAIALEASTLALYSTAEGFLTGNPGYFAAAGIYAQAALAAGIGARVLGANVTGGTEKTTAQISQGRSEREQKTISTTHEEESTREITIVNKGVIAGDFKDLARQIGNELKDDNRRTHFNVVKGF